MIYNHSDYSFSAITLSSQFHQEKSLGYDELCLPVVERLRFLFNELRPAIANEVSALSRLKILNTPPRWKRVVQKMIREKRAAAAGEVKGHTKLKA